MQTPLSKIEAEAKEKAAAVAAETAERVADQRARVLNYHLTGGGHRTGQARPGALMAPGGTPQGCIDVDTLNEAERSAVVVSLTQRKTAVEKTAVGSQDSVDVVVEYLRANDSACADFLRRCGVDTSDSGEEE